MTLVYRDIARVWWGWRVQFFWDIARGWKGGMVQIFFWNLTHFFDFEFKNTSNLIFLGFKVPSERLQGFQNRSYFLTYVVLKIKNWVRSCQHIGGTLCIRKTPGKRYKFSSKKIRKLLSRQKYVKRDPIFEDLDRTPIEAKSWAITMKYVLEDFFILWKIV